MIVCLCVCVCVCVLFLRRSYMETSKFHKRARAHTHTNTHRWPSAIVLETVPRERWTGEQTENCALLGYYATSSGNSLPTFRDSLSVPSTMVKFILLKKNKNLRLLTLKDGTDKLSRNVRKELSLLAA